MPAGLPPRHIIHAWLKSQPPSGGAPNRCYRRRSMPVGRRTLVCQRKCAAAILVQCQCQHSRAGCSHSGGSGQHSRCNTDHKFVLQPSLHLLELICTGLGCPSTGARPPLTPPNPPHPSWATMRAAPKPKFDNRTGCQKTCKTLQAAPRGKPSAFADGRQAGVTSHPQRPSRQRCRQRGRGRRRHRRRHGSGRRRHAGRRAGRQHADGDAHCQPVAGQVRTVCSCQLFKRHHAGLAPVKEDENTQQLV